jgi:type 1 glutamine amidotransferase
MAQLVGGQRGEVRRARAVSLCLSAVLGLHAMLGTSACSSTRTVHRASSGIGATAAPFRVLIFSRTVGFRHDSIPAGIEAIVDLGERNDFAVDYTEDAAAFTIPNLGRYRAVIFLNTTGDILEASQESALESYIRAGGGFVGVHAAADAEYSWPFYGDLVGAYFSSHSAVQQATLNVEDRTAPATAHLGPTWTRTDEWYNFRTNPRSYVHVLATLDESTYAGGTMGADHPIAWCRAYAGGRSFYTGGGHTVSTFAEQAFRLHLLGGIRYAAGVAECRPASAPPSR